MRISTINPIFFRNHSGNAKQENKTNVCSNSITELPSYYYKPVSFKGYNFREKPEFIQKAWNRLKAFPSDYSIDKWHLEEIFNDMKYYKKDFIEVFSNETGFPNLKTVSEKIDEIVINNGQDIAKTYDTDLLFAGYNKNCSVGKGLALPGSDCDGLFLVYDKNRYNSGELRWRFRCNNDNRILHVDENFLPEVFNIDEIKKGLTLADQAYSSLKNELTPDDYRRFLKNINYDGTDYVKAAEFNIRLSKFIHGTEEKNFVAMVSFLPEYLRNGKVLANGLGAETTELIKDSPLYKYSNITRQEGQTNCVKQKIRHRELLNEKFQQAGTDEKFQLIKDICHRNFDLNVSKENEKYFINIGGDSGSLNSEMGNILSMYRQLRS